MGVMSSNAFAMPRFQSGRVSACGEYNDPPFFGGAVGDRAGAGIGDGGPGWGVYRAWGPGWGPGYYGYGWGWRRNWCYWHPRACGWW